MFAHIGVAFASSLCKFAGSFSKLFYIYNSPSESSVISIPLSLEQPAFIRFVVKIICIIWHFFCGITVILNTDFNVLFLICWFADAIFGISTVAEKGGESIFNILNNTIDSRLFGKCEDIKLLIVTRYG